MRKSPDAPPNGGSPDDEALLQLPAGADERRAGKSSLATRDESSLTSSGEKADEAPADSSQDGKKRRREKRPKLISSGFNFGSFLKARRTEMTALVIALLISNIFILQVRHFEGRYANPREVRWWMPFWQTLEQTELGLYDVRFTERGMRIPQCHNKIAIVGIDELSMGTFKTWPIPRSWHAKVARRLKRAGAKVIVFDLGFTDRQNIYDDLEFATAMHETGNVLLPSNDAVYRVEKKNRTEATAANLLTSPIEASAYDEEWVTNGSRRRDLQWRGAYEAFKDLGFNEQSPDISIATLQKDLDGAYRRYPFRLEFNNNEFVVGGLGVLAAGVFQDLADGEKNEAYETALRNEVWPTYLGQAVEVPARLNLPRSPLSPVHYTIPINFYGPSGTFETDSYVNVLTWRIEDPFNPGKTKEMGLTDEQMRKKFKDRIVFIGATADILKDDFPVPYMRRVHHDIDASEVEALDELKIYGVEVHATAAAMLLDGNYIHTVEAETTIALVYILTIVSALWTAFLRGWVNNLANKAQLRASKLGIRWSLHAWIWFLLYMLLIAPPFVGFWQLAKWLFEWHNIWVIVTYPAASAATASTLMLMLLFASESVDRRKTIAQLGAYVSPEVRDEILAQPEGKFVRPRRVKATMLFSDLEGFTSYSETHEPEQVVDALNDYFNRMVRIVRAHGGNMDKFIGDAVMAEFGMPVPRYDHALQALLCAIAMQEECARFRQDTGIDFYMRVGIHTGELIAGSVGAAEAGYFNYTAIGDTVNLASRLEGKNKEFNSWIMCSAETFEAAGDMVEAENARAGIKGKSQEVEVYIVRGLRGKPEQMLNWGHQLSAPASKPLSDSDVAEPMSLGIDGSIPALPAPKE